MANIKLKSLAKQFEDKTPVTVSNLPDLAEKVTTKYSDLHLDLVNVQTSGLYKDNPISSNINISDIQRDTNLDAILNSVRNWMRTTKYSRLLNPDISIDLRQYLFEAVNEYTAYFIGMEIMKYLPYYEPRINIAECNISVDVDNGLFEIILHITIPSINNKSVTLKEILGSDNFLTY